MILDFMKKKLRLVKMEVNEFQKTHEEIEIIKQMIIEDNKKMANWQRNLNGYNKKTLETLNEHQQIRLAKDRMDLKPADIENLRKQR